MATPRANVNQKFQWGAEETDNPGHGGTAHNHLGTFSTQVAPVASGAFGLFRPSGGKYVGQVVSTDIYAEGAFTDTIDFNTDTFLLAGNVGTDGGTADGDGAFTYRHTPVPFGELNTLSFVAQEGQPGAVYNYNYVIIPDLNYRFMRTGASQTGGRILGKKLGPGDIMTSATLRQGRAISGIKSGVWQAETWDDLLTDGATRFDPVALDLAWRHNGVFAPWFALDDSIESFASALEQGVDAGVQITILADVDAGLSDILGIFKYSSMEEGDRLYVKVLNYGPIIHDDVRFTKEGNFNLVISGPPRRSTVGPLRVWQWDALCVPEVVEDVINPPFDWTLVNTLPLSAFDV